MSGRKPIAIVTGAYGGMGLACTRRMGKRFSLVIADRDQAKLDREAAALRAEGMDVVAAIGGDVRDAAHCSMLADQAAGAGDLLCLVNTAGLSPSMADWAEILDTNLPGATMMAQNVLEKGAPGVVSVMIASVAAWAVPKDKDLDETLDNPLAADFHARFETHLEAFKTLPPVYFAYATSKYGVIRLTRRLARAYGAKDGRIVSISPGIIDTPMGRMETAPGKLAAADRPATGFGRLGRADEIASTVEFLASDNASYISGTDLVVDGAAGGPDARTTA